jgi:hypothetical protein
MAAVKRVNFDGQTAAFEWIKKIWLQSRDLLIKS